MHARQAWDYIKEHGWMGMNSPESAYLYSAEVFDALGESENCRAILEMGHQAIIEWADQINVPEWRRSFLENSINIRNLMEMWERYKR